MNQEISNKEMRLSFNTYDFLGYFVPGAVFLTIILVFEYYLQKIFPSIPLKPIYSFIINMKFYFLGDESHWSLEIIIIVLFIIVCYSLGHIIASLAAFFIDRVLSGSCLRYPYLILFNISEKNSAPNRLRLKSGIINFIIFLNIFLVFSLFCYIPLFISIIVIGIMIFYLFKKLINYSKTINDNKDKLPPNHSSNYNKRKRIKLLFIKVIKCPFVPLLKRLDNFTHIFKTFLGIYRPFSDDFIIKFKNEYKRVFESDIEDDRVNVYWFVRNYISDKSSFFNGLLTNWFNLYSYARNISTSIYLSFVYLILLIKINLNINKSSDRFMIEFFSNEYKIIIIKILIILLLISSLILLLRYYYLYFTYYNKYLFRTFYYLSKQSKS
ncbi:MAG: hypothetical protein N2485_08330 [bacterium]|nr:hypothetical protein [bacterium]